MRRARWAGRWWSWGFREVVGAGRIAGPLRRVVSAWSATTRPAAARPKGAPSAARLGLCVRQRDEPLADELTGAVECCVGLVEHAGEALEDVGDVGDDLEGDADVGRRGAGCQAGRVVE